MRLIDADVLMPNAKYKGKYDTVNAYDIVNCPTIDAEPIRHGKWIAGDSVEVELGEYVYDWECSVCGRVVWRGKEDIKNEKYCYHCGTKMDEVE